MTLEFDTAGFREPLENTISSLRLMHCLDDGEDVVALRPEFTRKGPLVFACSIMLPSAGKTRNE